MTATNRNPRSIFVMLGVVTAIGLIGAVALQAFRPRYDALSSTYGRSRGPQGAAEPGGTGVLAGMFRQAGCRVRSVTRLSPRLDKANVLIWFPTDFNPPSAEARQRLESWLWQGSGRSLIVVGRDYNPAEHYWREALPAAPPELQEQFQREAARSAADHWKQRATTDAGDAGWFAANMDEPPQKIANLKGPWAEGVDSAATNLFLDTRLTPPKTQPFGKVTELLSGDGEPLVREVEHNGNRLIIVQNGSFLLNYPLVNHEHRKLAGKLIERCNASGDVLFIESNSDPAIVKSDVRERQTLIEFFEIWPLNAIVVHAVVLGFIACLAYAPIFGRPKELPAVTATDFSRHVAALGRLLGGTGAREYAVQKLQQYRRRAQRGSGKGHRTPVAKPATPAAPPAPPSA